MSKATGSGGPGRGQSCSPGPADAPDFIALYRADAMARIRIVKQGLPAATEGQLARYMSLSQRRVKAMLGLRTVTGRSVLSMNDSAHVLGLALLIGQTQQMVIESGRPEGFNAAAWLAQWLDRPVAAIGGKRPVDLLDTDDGRAIVSTVLERMRTGVYS